MWNRCNQRAAWAVAFSLSLFFITGSRCESATTKNTDTSPVLVEARQRVDFVRRQVPEITRCAEVVAKSWVENKTVLLHYVYGGSSLNFTAEFCSRAGGLDNAQPMTVRVPQYTKNDVLVFAQRSWEKGADDLRKLLKESKARGWTTIVFASRKGMPEDMPIDYLIDNDAPNGSEAGAPMNEITNAINGWVWSGELTAALTRLGFHPAVLHGMILPGSTAHNKTYQHGSPALYPIDKDKAVPAGQLGNAYLDAIGKLLVRLDTPAMRKQIVTAANYATDCIQSGHIVWGISYTHFLNGYVNIALKSPMKGLSFSYAEAEHMINSHVKPGDLVFFFGEWTVNTQEYDFVSILQKTGAHYITSYRLGKEPLEEPLSNSKQMYSQDMKDALLVIDQPWTFQNAAIPIPFPPGNMAATSGICAALIYRELDLAIATDVAKKGIVAKPPPTATH